MAKNDALDFEALTAKTTVRIPRRRPRFDDDYVAPHRPNRGHHKESLLYLRRSIAGHDRSKLSGTLNRFLETVSRNDEKKLKLASKMGATALSPRSIRKIYDEFRQDSSSAKPFNNKVKQQREVINAVNPHVQVRLGKFSVYDRETDDDVWFLAADLNPKGEEDVLENEASMFMNRLISPSDVHLLNSRTLDAEPHFNLITTGSLDVAKRVVVEMNQYEPLQDVGIQLLPATIDGIEY